MTGLAWVGLVVACCGAWVVPGAPEALCRSMPTATRLRKPFTLAAWPVDRPGNWSKRVNETLEESEIERLRTSVVRGRPFGGDAWVKRTASALGLLSSLRERGRLKKEINE